MISRPVASSCGHVLRSLGPFVASSAAAARVVPLNGNNGACSALLDTVKGARVRHSTPAFLQARVLLIPLSGRVSCAHRAASKTRKTSFGETFRAQHAIYSAHQRRKLSKSVTMFSRARIESPEIFNAPVSRWKRAVERHVQRSDFMEDRRLH